ncbi:MAG: phosphoribosylformylglycinamidine cyclo-ligase [Elusimicrobia bacterium CG1_02_37_114]|nr:MAG: phosphoribosylformylglycinamidine cyclo-ligase [Elusimicrobia bacterium CG1_02_37_114]PIZ13306.1 MAG: phosphoribosylformylglycinamidine cyclo-ligase [Elusimicrobia bacterium CG_4_10_14_0_8_um_filter_37_32]
MTTYRQSGVNIDEANKSVKWLKKFNPEIGLFSGLFQHDFKKYKNPLLVGATDGVGTKLKLAFILNKHDTIGIDLVAMNVNDIICCGARPLFFLDYFACSKLDTNIFKNVIKGIVNGCKQAGCTLLGGETAEMPDFYKLGEYDLAGFCVGVVDKNKVIDGRKIAPGDVIIGLKSSGPHSNGYSLIRRALKDDIKKYARQLLTPTTIYVKDVMSIVDSNLGSCIHGISHITGGGFYDNIERFLPEYCSAKIYRDRWDVPAIFNIIQREGNVSDHEMCRVFNMGIGMVLIVDKSGSERIRRMMKDSVVIGQVTKGKGKVEIVSK